MAAFSSKKDRLNSPGPTKKLFTRDTHNFKFYRTPNISVSADCGPSGEIGNLNAISHESSPAALFPTLTWHFERPNNPEVDLISEKEQNTHEYLLLVEDIDSSRWTWINAAPTPALLGVFYGIPPGKTGVCATDLVKVKKSKLKWITTAQRGLAGGFKHGDVDGKVWKQPKSFHRVHFQVVALSNTVDTLELSEHPTRESFNGAVEGRVLGWGEWIGIYERQ